MAKGVRSIKLDIYRFELRKIKETKQYPNGDKVTTRHYPEENILIFEDVLRYIYPNVILKKDLFKSFFQDFVGVFESKFKDNKDGTRAIRLLYRG